MGARYTLGLLLVIYVVNHVDRQVMNILGEAVKTDLGLAGTNSGDSSNTNVRPPLARPSRSCARGTRIRRAGRSVVGRLPPWVNASPSRC